MPIPGYHRVRFHKRKWPGYHEKRDLRLLDRGGLDSGLESGLGFLDLRMDFGEPGSWREPGETDMFTADMFVINLMFLNRRLVVRECVVVLE